MKISFLLIFCLSASIVTSQTSMAENSTLKKNTSVINKANPSSVDEYCSATNGNNYAWISDVKLGDINNTSVGFPVDGYSDFTTLSTYLKQGSTYPIIIDVSYTNATNRNIAVWIDFNSNDSFEDAGEQVLLANPPQLEQLSGATITIPAGAPVGTKRMRIRANYKGVGIISPCGYDDYLGETEDYTVDIASSSTPVLSVLPNSLDFGYAPLGGSVADQYTVSGSLLNTGPIVVTAPTGFGVSLSDGGPFTSTVNVFYTAPTLANTTIYVSFAPTVPGTAYVGNIDNTGGDASENVAVSGSTDEYCAATNGYNYAWISRVNIEDIDNSTTGFPFEGYSNFTSLSTSLEQGTTYPILVDLSYTNSTTKNIAVWIDFNNNNSFADAGEQVLLANPPALEQLTGATITIPANAPNTTTRMRVRANYQGNSNILPCGYDSFMGETEDYTVVIGVAAPATASWTGAIDNDWHNAGNWDSGIPGAVTDVTIPTGLTNYPTISASAQCNNLYIASGASLLDGGLLTVNGTVSAERDYTGGSWHLIGSPVNGETANTFYGLYLQSHNEITNSYFNISDETTVLVPGQGFALWNSNNATATYAGSLSSSVTMPLTRTADGFDQGWNLVSNPYTSSIDWESVAGWVKTNIDASIYFYNFELTGNWAIWNGTVGVNGGSQHVASGQGFFVSVSDGQTTGSLGFSKEVQIHHNTTFFKNEPADIIKLKVSGNNYSDEMAVYFREEATNGYDSQMDAHQLPGFDNLAPYIYSSANEGMAVNVLPEVMQVPVNVKVGSEMGTFTIEAVSNGEFNELYLEDLATGTITDLNESGYSFVYIPGIESRFVLHFGTVGIDNISGDLSNIYSYNKDIYVAVPFNTSGTISIYDMVGREVISSSIDNTVNTFTLETSAYYIVKVLSDKNIETKKVFIK